MVASMERDYSRRDFTKSEFEELAISLGRVTLTWNDLLVSVSGLFATITKIPNQLIPNTVFFTVKSDRDQINILKRLAVSPAIGIEIPEDIREQITWVCGRCQNLIDVRNDLLHTPFGINSGNVFSYHLGAHERAMKYATKYEALEDCAWFFQAAIILRDWSDSLDDALTHRDYTLPNRPEWQDRPSRN